jgi:hypothetical protein
MKESTLSKITASVAVARGMAQRAVCTENLSSGVVVVKSAKDGV